MRYYDMFFCLGQLYVHRPSILGFLKLRDLCMVWITAPNEHESRVQGCILIFMKFKQNSRSGVPGLKLKLTLREINAGVYALEYLLTLNLDLMCFDTWHLYLQLAPEWDTQCSDTATLSVTLNVAYEMK